MLTVNSIAGERSTFRVPSSSSSRSAASSKRTSADIHGFVSEFASGSAKVVVSNRMEPALQSHYDRQRRVRQPFYMQFDGLKRIAFRRNGYRHESSNLRTRFHPGRGVHRISRRGGKPPPIFFGPFGRAGIALAAARAEYPAGSGMGNARRLRARFGVATAAVRAGGSRHAGNAEESHGPDRERAAARCRPAGTRLRRRHSGQREHSRGHSEPPQGAGRRGGGCLRRRESAVGYGRPQWRGSFSRNPIRKGGAGRWTDQPVHEQSQEDNARSESTRTDRRRASERSLFRTRRNGDFHRAGELQGPGRRGESVFGAGTRRRS